MTTATILRDPDQIRDHFMGLPEIAFDIETSGLSPWKDLVAVITLADRHGTVGVLHLRYNPVPPWIKEMLENPETLVIGHNVVGFDAIFLAAINGCGLDVSAVRWYDTMVGEQCLLPAGRRDLSASLAAALERRFKTSKKARKSSLAGGHSWMNGDLTDEQVDYIVNDVLHLVELRERQLAKADELDPTGRLARVAIPLEMDILPSVMTMKLNGMMVDHVKLDEFRAEAEATIARLAPELEQALGWLPNMNAPAQLKRALNEAGIEVADTRKETLQDLEVDDANPVARLILDYREANKFLSMYGPEWIKEHEEIDGCVHPTFRQLGTDTTRFACVRPNFQQVPRPKRKMFAAPQGYKIVAADYSGLEVRIAATVSHEPMLLEALRGADMHRSIAAQMFGKPEADISFEERFLAKRCVFTLLFGGGAQRLYDDTRRNKGVLTLEEATELYRQFFATYPALWQERIRAQDISRHQQVYTIQLPSGLRRTLIKGLSLSPATVLNTRVQGAAAVGLKSALRMAQQAGLTKYMAAVVHDEIVMVVPDAEVEWAADTLANAMLDGMLKITSCPMRVEVAIGQAWEKTPVLAWTLIDGEKKKEDSREDIEGAA